MKKSRLFRGITSSLATVTSLCVFGSILAFENSGQVNIFLNETPPTQDVAGDANYYPSAYNDVNSMRVAEKANEIQTQEEGSVLFRNENNALPLSKTNSITLFGRTAADNIFRGGSGGSATTAADATNLYDALKAKGVKINDTVYNALKASTVTRSRGNIGEVPASFYTSELQSSYSSNYNDAAVVVLGRYGGEQQDLTAGGDSNQDNITDSNGDPVDSSGVAMLSLHQEEKDLINMVKSSNKFGKIIVILNTGYAMDIGELASLGVDSILWVGYPGYTGFDGVANVIVGEADPSGRTVDTYATNSISSPAMRNYGGFTWTNIDASGQDKYLIYAEGIYTGYKYYETRYQDQILNINNAKSTKGIYAGESTWDYGAEMVYTFGSGKSYADFSQTLQSINWDKTTHQVTATVKVRNNGVATGSSYTGKSKDVVQLYVQLPYENGQAEKSAIQLIGYGKTKELAKGEEDTVSIIADDYLFATYDNKATNGADTSLTGCYTFDAGDYYFAIGDDAHDALNNVLAKRSVTGLIDAEGNDVMGVEGKVIKDNLATLDNTTHAKSETGEIVSNQFDDMDVNYYFDEDQVTYLTRSDWNTYPKRYTNLTATDEMKRIIEGSLYTKPTDAPSVSSFTHSQDVTIKFIEMKDVPYDDPKWETFINQFTPSQMSKIVGEKFGNDAVAALGIPATTAADGPDGIQANGGYSHVCTTVSTSTFNNELIAKRGQFMAEDAIWTKQNGVYGFGANMHRTPYGGRNFEYYSEDMVLSYLVGGVQTKAAQDKGLTTYVKHFCANDQEVWRNGSSTMMTEQAFRQGPLKGFEGSFTKGGSLGTMTSNARCGLNVTSQSKAIMTQVLRNEWGFKGLAMTDSSKGSRYYIYTKESLAAGIDQFNNDDTRGDEMKNLLIKDKDGYMWQRAREITKHFCYTLVHNFCINGLTKETKIVEWTPTWKKAIYAVDISLGVLAVASLAVAIYFSIYENKKKEN